MFRRKFNFVIALGASVVLHGLFFATGNTLWNWHLDGAVKPTEPLDVAISLQDPIADELKPDNDKFPDMGEATGVGVGSNKSEGPNPINAREADEDQALLSRDPQGPGRVGDTPALLSGPLGENGTGGQQGQISIFEPQIAQITPPPVPPATPQADAETPIPPPTPAVQMKPVENDNTPVAPAIAVAPEPVLDPKNVLPKAVKLTEAPPTQARVIAAAVLPNQSPLRPQTGDGRAPGVDLHQANPAHQSDSESDPFSRIGSVVFRDGKLEIQKGRKVKTTRPHVHLSGEVDLFNMGGATVVLTVSIDASGKVTSVDVKHSSGSVDVDQPCRVAVYDWWFEPTRDKKGNPVPDVFPFTIRFQ